MFTESAPLGRFSHWVAMPVCLSGCLSVCLDVCLFVGMSVCLFHRVQFILGLSLALRSHDQPLISPHPPQKKKIIMVLTPSKKNCCHCLWQYYPHGSRASVSPVCGIFHLYYLFIWILNLEIIFQNFSISYKILVKFLHSWLGHTIFLGLLLLRRAKAGIQAFRYEGKTLNFQLLKWISDQLRYKRLNIGHVCGCWSISRNFSRPSIFVVHINHINFLLGIP